MMEKNTQKIFEKYGGVMRTKELTEHGKAVLDAEQAAIDEKLMELQKELLKLKNAKKEYEPIAHQIDNLREEKQNILVDDAGREGTRKRVQEMMEYFQEQPAEVTKYDEQLVRRFVEKITV